MYLISHHHHHHHHHHHDPYQCMNKIAADTAQPLATDLVNLIKSKLFLSGEKMDFGVDSFDKELVGRRGDFRATHH